MRFAYWSIALVFVSSLACTFRSHQDLQPLDGGPVSSGAAKTAVLSGNLVVSSVSTASVADDGGIVFGGTLDDLIAPLRTSREIHKVYGKSAGLKASPAPSFVAGDIAVRLEGERLTPEETLRVTKIDGFRCEHRAYASPHLHLIRCTKANGTRLTVGETQELAGQLEGISGVRYAEVDSIVQPMAVPSDPYFPLQWHYPLMNVPAAWDVTGGSSGIAVAVIDTGFRPHPDLAPNVAVSVDMISDAINAADGDGRDLDGSDVAGAGPNGTSSFHGTHVAGTIAAANDGKGVLGVAPMSSLVNVRALGAMGGSQFDVAASIYWSAGGEVPGMPMNPVPAKVINMSLGSFGPPSEMYQEVIDAAVGAGAIIVVAAGNEDIDAQDARPANQKNVIVVGATGSNGQITQYSNYGAAIDVMAPGGDTSVDRDGDGYPDGVLSTYSDDSTGAATWVYLQGTSMAAPHVAGLIALMASVNPSITSSQAEAVLKSTANAAFKCNVGCGAGLVDAYAAVAAAGGNAAGSGPAKLVVAHGTFALQKNDVVPLTVSNPGGSPLTVSAKASGTLGPRIEIVNGPTLSVPGGKSATYQVYVDGTSLADGDYYGAIELSSNGGSAYILVSLTIAPAQAERVAIVAAVFKDSRGEWQVGDVASSNPSNGHAWSLEVPAGTYFLVAGVDADGDGKLFEDGEPVGFYKSMENPITVTASAGQVVGGLSFSVLSQRSVGGGEAKAVIGDACTTDDACSSGMCAADWPAGGYCTQSCDTSACPGGSTCVAFSTGDFCMADCSAPGGGQSTCRSGYTCTALTNGAGVCL